ncbi:MAG: hemolysin family protein [Egibacteraceae bacterium]
MDSVLLELGLVFLLVVMNAAFAGSEIALISLREGQIRRLSKGGRAGQALAALARDPNRFLATIQIGITLAGFLASATAAVSLAEPLIEPLRFLGDAAEPVTIVLVTILLTFVMLVFGELGPKRIAMQRAERWGLVAARPLGLLARLARPAVWLLGKSTDLTVRLLGGDPHAQAEEVSEEELRDLLASRRGFTAQQQHIFEGTFDIAERTLREIVVPRGKVFAIPTTMSATEAAHELAGRGHSRAPVVAGDLDNVAGVLHLRDLVGATGTAADQAREPLVLPETLGVLEALRQLRAERQHLAIVVDEYGGTAGIVTLEDMLEELVGEIWDEFDPDTAGIRTRSDGSLVLSGVFPIHDLDDLGVELPEGPYATVAGLVLHRLGRLPDQGEQLDIGNWRIIVERVSDRAITQVQVVPRR